MDKREKIQRIVSVAALGQGVWSLLIMRNSQFWHRAYMHSIGTALQRAIQIGRESAIGIFNNSGSCVPSELAVSLGYHLQKADIEWVQESFVAGTFTEPDTITVSSQVEEVLLSQWEFYQLTKNLGVIDFKEVIVAHELFHALEHRNAECRVSGIPLQIKGMWRKKTVYPKSVLSEIAAFSFARAFLHMEVSPNVLTLLLLDTISEAAAEKQLTELESISNDHEEAGYEV